MLEPLSAMAVLGFAMGTIGFVVSTISKVEEKVQEMRECEDRLRSFNWDLKEIVLALAAWRWVWIGKKPFSFETYIHFWGHHGVQEVRDRIDGIIGLSNDIRKLLRQPTFNKTGQSLRSSELNDWHQLIDNEVKQASSQLHASHRKVGQKNGLVRKVGFTLFRNPTLGEKIARLKRHVEGLKTVSCDIFRLRQEGDPYSEVNPRELHTISKLITFFDRVSSIGRSLYAQMSLSGLQWAIEVGPPEYDLDSWSEIYKFTHIYFVVSDETDRKLDRVQILANLSNSLPCTVKRIEDVILSHDRRRDRSEHDYFFHLLEKPHRRSRPLRTLLAEGIFGGEHRKSLEVDRADLAYGLGHWMILFWNTEWFYHLCTCGIRCTHLSDAHTRHSFVACETCDQSHPPWRVTSQFRLLGVILAEIALGLPISIGGSEFNSYVVGEETASSEQLLNILRRKCGSTTITKAVGCCLEIDPIVFDFGSSLRPEHLEKYFQEIVLPLKKYYETVSKHCQSTSGRRLRENANLTSWYDSDTD